MNTFIRQHSRQDMVTMNFVVVTFGLTNALATFMCLMNNVLCPHLYKFVVVFLDNISVYLKDKEDHKKHLEVVLQLLREKNLYANIRKCELF